MSSSIAVGPGGTAAAEDARSEGTLARWATPASWVVFGVCAAIVLGLSITHDFRDEPVAGDTSAHLFQALSLAYDSHSLNFDEHDLHRWQDLGWAQQPVGMFFQGYGHDRYAFAKPYGYSLYLAPFIRVLGPVHGIALANTLLLAALMTISILLLRTRYRGPAVPLLTGAFFLASYVYMYAFWVHTELFVALVTLIGFAGAVRFAQTGKIWWAVLTFVVIGFEVSEKAAAVALFGPIALVLLWKAPSWKWRFGLSAIALAVFAVAVLPYERYSDWKSFTPYGGDDRLFVQYATPFEGATKGWAHNHFEASSLFTNIKGPVDQKAESLFYELVGRHTGILVYLPVAFMLLIMCVACWRRADWFGRAALLSVLAYIVFYAVMFPTNYYGGGQSLGNRYFLQMAPAIIAVVVLMRVPRRWLVVGSLAGIVLGIAFLLPQHEDPTWGHVKIERTSALQRILPFESNQSEKNYFTCKKVEITHITACT